jgi:hypothetical protein
MKSKLLAAALLTACAVEPTPTPTPVVPTATVSGVVEINGAVANATVYLDTNDNNLLDAGEPQVAADATGHYTLTWTNNGPFYAHTIGAIVAPASTPIGLALHMRAPLGDTTGDYTGTAVISPFTTMVVSEMANDPTLTQVTATAKIASELTASQALTGQTIDVMADYSDNAQLRRTAGAVAALVSAAVDKGNSLQSHIDCNDATFFNPAIAAMDEQLATISDGVYKFSQLPASVQADLQQNPGNYHDYFIDTTAFADAIEAELLAAAEDLAAALFSELENEFVTQIEDECVAIVVEELLG